jgi:hypothetical protein
MNKVKAISASLRNDVAQLNEIMRSQSMPLFKTDCFIKGDLDDFSKSNQTGDGQLHFGVPGTPSGKGYGALFAIEWTAGNGYGDGWASGQRSTEISPFEDANAYWRRRFGDGSGQGTGCSDLPSIYNSRDFIRF